MDGIIIRAGYSEALHRMPEVPEKRHGWEPLSGAELIRSVLPEISRLAEAIERKKRQRE
ncbi:hypothetical protein [Methylococcus geothermalis]|uniref:Uncharacterized protein n=1 Tax=Methylococcus geothermalis TaxID=2681310 RepID=A0A858Q4C8_9GAMM|nr:hypothetical protein [Methylococcus geothermalis]QJD28663.1 hypothetical protein GNH96_00895 [Methylococcus geothermalis]